MSGTFHTYWGGTTPTTTEYTTSLSDRTVTNTYIGRSSWTERNGDAYLSAAIYNLAVWDRALTDAEMSTMLTIWQRTTAISAYWARSLSSLLTTTTINTIASDSYTTGNELQVCAEVTQGTAPSTGFTFSITPSDTGAATTIPITITTGLGTTSTVAIGTPTGLLSGATLALVDTTSVSSAGAVTNNIAVFQVCIQLPHKDGLFAASRTLTLAITGTTISNGVDAADGDRTIAVNPSALKLVGHITGTAHI